MDIDTLIGYTEWERQKWNRWFREQGDGALSTSAGPNGDGRFSTIGEVIRHIFSAEKRYIERLSGRPMTDTSTIAADTIDALFAFGEQSRHDLCDFVKTFPAEKWDVMEEHKIMTSTLRATPRKFIFHVVIHEIRHWAQIATLFRLNGLKVDFHDFLFSPVLGEEVRK